MSVVNKMLQDLESRQADEQAVQANYQPPGQKRPSTAFLLIAVVLIIAIAWLALDNMGLFDVKPPSTQPAQISRTEPATETPNITETSMSDDTEETKPEALVPEIPAEFPPSTALQAQDEANEAALSTITQTSSDVPVSAEPIEDVPVEKVTPVDTSQGQFAMSSSADPNSPAQLKAAAKLALQQGDNATAVKTLETLLEFEPDNLAARKRLASLYFAVGDTQKTEQILQQGLVMDGQNGELKLMLARLYSQQEQHDIAYSILQGQAVTLTDGTDLLATRASLAERTSRFDAALEDYQTLVTMQPDNARWWLGLAVILERQKDYPLASRAYQKAAELDQLPTDVSRFIQQRLAYLAEAS